MSCSKWKHRLSSYLDGEVSAVERLEIETHLGECRACRRHHRQLLRTVETVRRLETLEAPRFSLHRVRPGATRRADRAARWERIRSGRLAPPQPMLRPVVLAALALMVVLAVLHALQRDGRNTPADATPVEPGFEVTEVPMNVPGPTSDERPEWLQREIARRFVQAREPASAPDQVGPGDQEAGGGPEPTAPGTAVERPQDGFPQPEQRVAEAREAGTPQAEPLPETIPPAVEGRAGEEVAALQPPEPEPGPPAAAEAAAAGTGATVKPSPVTARPMVALIQPRQSPTVTGEPERTPTPTRTPTTHTNQRVRTLPPTAPADEERPAPVEIPTVYQTVATLGMEDTALSVVDPSVPSPVEGAQLERFAPGSGTVEERAAPELEPEPDPETGIVPPVLLEHPGPELGDRAAAVRDRALLAPLGVRLTVNAKGEVDEAQVVSSSGLPWLDELLADAVTTWTFRPAEDAAGVAVPASLELVVEFEVQAD